MKLMWVAASIGFGCVVASAATSPYDFTGHWSGTARVRGQTVRIFADFAGTGTFTGNLGVDLVPLTTCTAEGKQARRVTIALTCSDGGKTRVRGRLDPAAMTIVGTYHNQGRHKGHGAFTLSTSGPCVTPGGDCTDPATGGGESAVCCNGDCTRGTTNGIESHACN